MSMIQRRHEDDDKVLVVALYIKDSLLIKVLQHTLLELERLNLYLLRVHSIPFRGVKNLSQNKSRLSLPSE